jgi:hypothetical protein
MPEKFCLCLRFSIDCPTEKIIKIVDIISNWQLKYGGDGGDIGPPPQDDDGVELPPLEQSDNIIAVTNSNWKQVGR